MAGTLCCSTVVALALAYVFSEICCCGVHRNNREVLGVNIGGYDGAPPRGEFGFLRENYGGISGPRHELGEILEWLVEVRERQAFLGYSPGDQTYLYDIPVWCAFIPFHVLACVVANLD
jgi:hypothetical protein